MVSEKRHYARAEDAIRNLKVYSFKGTSVLVTGGAGFFGVHLGRALHLLGADVTLFDVQPPIEDFSPEIKFVQGDICDKELVRSLCKGKSCVFHIASFGMSGPDMLKPTEFIENINVGGTINVIEGCCEHGVPRLVYTSTVAVVFGGFPLENVTEETCQTLPIETFTDDYSKTKCMAEKKVIEANGLLIKGGDKLHTCAIRPPGIYGVGERRHFPRAVNAMESGQLLFTIGGLDALVDFVHVDNLVNAHILAAEALSNRRKHISGGEVYFITDGNPINNWQFFRPLIEGLGFTFPKYNLPFQLVFVIVLILEWIHQLIKPIYHFQPFLTRTELYQISVAHYLNIDKARNQLGYEPLKRDIEDIVQYYWQRGHRCKSSKVWKFIAHVIIAATLALFAIIFIL